MNNDILSISHKQPNFDTMLKIDNGWMRELKWENHKFIMNSPPNRSHKLLQVLWSTFEFWFTYE
jgi:hypothetical protein